MKNQGKDSHIEVAQSNPKEELQDVHSEQAGMLTRIPKYTLDITAVIISIIAVVISALTYFNDQERQAVNSTLAMCEGFYLGDELRSSFDRIKANHDDTRAWGDVFNYLNFTAIAWDHGHVEPVVLRECLGPGYKLYCEVLASGSPEFDTRWETLEKLAQDSGFWEQNVPPECTTAIANITIAKT